METVKNQSHNRNQVPPTQIKTESAISPINLGEFSAILAELLTRDPGLSACLLHVSPDPGGEAFSRSWIPDFLTGAFLLRKEGGVMIFQTAPIGLYTGADPESPVGIYWGLNQLYRELAEDPSLAPDVLGVPEGDESALEYIGNQVPVPVPTPETTLQALIADLTNFLLSNPDLASAPVEFHTPVTPVSYLSGRRTRFSVYSIRGDRSPSPRVVLSGADIRNDNE